jgi:outer membrane protein
MELFFMGLFFRPLTGDLEVHFLFRCGRPSTSCRGTAGATVERGDEPTAAAEVRKLSTSLNRMMGWPDDTELALVPPEPLAEDISLEEVSTKPIGGNPDVIEAEQTVIKARAAAALSKLEYIPTVAAMGGYLFQNALPSVPSNYGYGGVVASYNLFDFGKRERAVKEARAKVEMAEIALQLTKEKVAAEVVF